MIPHSKNKTKQAKRFLGKTADWCLDLIFPKFCFGCQKEGAYLCADCKNRLRCGEAVIAIPKHREKQSQLHHYPFCPACKNKIIFPQKCSRGCKSQIKLALSPFSYDNFLVKDLIHNFKYNFVKSLGVDLGEFLIESIKNSPLEKAIAHRPENFLIISVPLHRRRLAWRGFNQSEILAKEIAKALDIKFSNALKRIKNTKPQIEMVSADERQKNIDGAFVLRRPKKFLSFPLSLLSFSFSFLSFPRTRESRPKSNLDPRLRGDDRIERGDDRIERGDDRSEYKNKTVILIDDMITTGATLEECAKILKQSGAREIWALTVAK